MNIKQKNSKDSKNKINTITDLLQVLLNQILPQAFRTGEIDQTNLGIVSNLNKSPTYDLMSELVLNI